MQQMSWRGDRCNQSLPPVFYSFQPLFLFLRPSLWLCLSLEIQSTEDQQASKCWFTTAGDSNTGRQGTTGYLSSLPSKNWELLGAKPLSPQRESSTSQWLLLLQFYRAPITRCRSRGRFLPCFCWCRCWYGGAQARVCPHLCFLGRVWWRGGSPSWWVLSTTPVLQMVQ